MGRSSPTTAAAASRRSRSIAASSGESASDALSPEEAAIDRDLREAAAAVVGELRPIDIETIHSLASGRRTAGATFRKRLERALARFRLAWRARHGAE